MTPGTPFVSLTTLCGFIAKYATEQSPYHCPDDLVEVIRSFWNNALGERMKDMPESWPIIHATRENLKRVLETHLFTQPQVLAWNNRKNGRDGHGFISRHDGPRNPDDDFIDLDALRMNVVRDCLKHYEEGK